MYGNEAAIGRAIRDSGLPRKEFYVVTKVDPGNTAPERFLRSVGRSLEALDGNIDLLLIHWPPETALFDAAVDCLMEALEREMTKHIGVSNFSPNMMRRAQQRTGGKIIANQVEFHLLIGQQTLLTEASNLGIALLAYSPLARGRALKPEIILTIAKRLDRAPSEIALRWILQQSVIAIPMTTKRENAVSNLSALDFTLCPDDMSEIASLGTREGRLINPACMSGRWDE
jgi:diketogulonate reductase-like aldo/keto reductase